MTHRRSPQGCFPGGRPKQAVGAYVDEDTRVENDEVIKDQVLTHSRGCIDSYEKLSEKSEDGVTHVTIRAVVKPDEVVSCLRKANVAMTDLSGEQFWAKVTSQRQEEKDAESLLRKALDGFPENCLKAEPIGEPRQDHNETVTRLGITVRIAVDPQAYQTFSRELQRVLDQIAKRKHEQETATTFPKAAGLGTARSSLAAELRTVHTSFKVIFIVVGQVHSCLARCRSSNRQACQVACETAHQDTFVNAVFKEIPFSSEALVATQILSRCGSW